MLHLECFLAEMAWRFLFRLPIGFYLLSLLHAHLKDLFAIRASVTLKAHFHVYFKNLCPYPLKFQYFYMNIIVIAFCTV